MSNVFFTLYAGLSLWGFFSVIMHGSRPTKSLAWALIIFVLPIGGALLYYMFGVNRRKFKFFRLKRSQKRRLYDIENRESEGPAFDLHFSSKPSYRLSKLIKNNSYLSASKGNKVRVLNSGRETFDAIFEAIAAAEKFIHVQYYIFEEGELQDRFYELFKSKIANGVEVRMIYDSFGSVSFRGKLKKRFRAIGVKSYPMMPLRFGSLLFTLNYRNHRKIIVVDGKVGFTGGINVSDKYIKSTPDLGIWQDLHVRLEGPVVNSLHRVFIKDYHFASKEVLLLQPNYLPEPQMVGESIVQIAASGPDSGQPAIMQQYIAMIGLAEERIYISNPYFIPGTAVIQALKIAAQSGIEVNLLVPKKGDSLLVTYGMYSNFEDFLAVGINIFTRTDFSHSKVIVIDGKIASIGSGNFDYRSFEHNFEANAIIYDAAITEQIVAVFERECEEAEQLSFQLFRKRPGTQKFLEGLAKFFSPLL